MPESPRNPADSPPAPPCAVIWGLGSGLHIVDFVADGGRVVLFPIDIEPRDHPQVHTALARHSELRRAMAEGRIEIVHGEPGELAARFRDLASGPRPRLYIHRPALSDVPPRFAPLARVIERTRDERARSPRIEARLRDNLRRNLPALARAFSLEALAGTGGLGLVLAAGPSLTPVLHALGPDTLQRSSTIIAVDTAIGPCARLGLPIDVVCTVDPHPASAAHIAPLSMSARADMVLAFQPYAWPEVIEAFPRRCAALPEFDRFAAAAAPITHLPQVQAAGTVLLFALQCAIVMDCDPVVLVGADFAHLGQRSHADGTAHAHTSEDIGVYVFDRRDRPIPSTTSLIGFKAAIEAYVAGLVRSRERSPQIWAVDGGGARIDHLRGVDVTDFAAYLRARPDLLPPRAHERWDRWLGTHPRTDEEAQAIEGSLIALLERLAGEGRSKPP